MTRLGGPSIIDEPSDRGTDGTSSTIQLDVLAMVTLRPAQHALPAIAAAHEPIRTALWAVDPLRPRVHSSAARMLAGPGTAEPDPSATTGEP